MDTKATCLDLLAAQAEATVQSIIDSVPELRDAANWRPLDRRETNFNVTSNQASDGGKALTELMTNMVDAVLMKYAHLKGIDPLSLQAPRTMYEAVDRLIKPLRGGKLINLDSRDHWLRDFAQKHLVIGIAGARSKKEGLPSYTFVDNGEGQRPEDFESTFLSLSAGNKKEIPFVQGKYNMGSSGVLGYCGLKWFKLIVSRRYDGTSPWGWTLMRRRPSGGMPVAEYFVMPSGDIPTFEAEALYPFHKGDGKRYDGVFLSTGTVIKLYDYQVGSKFLSFRGAREALNENLVETILPFRLLDFRQTPDPKRGGDRAEGIDPRPFYGMEFLLLRSHKENDQDEDEEDAAGTGRVQVADVEHPRLGRIAITAIPLKRTIPGWLKETNTNNRVFHAVNGQVQFKQTRGYVSQTCGFPALKDRCIIIVDASSMTLEAHNDVWKGDREHIRNTIVGELYRDEVTKAIRESKELRELQNQIAREELERAAKSERNDLFQKLVNEDRNLAGLLTNRDPEIRLPAAGGEDGSDSGSGKFEGKPSPTFVRIEERIRDKGLVLPINRSRPLSARTDAENGYLRRIEYPGKLVLGDELTERFASRGQLHDGRLTIYLTPIEGKLKVGDTFESYVGLYDDTMAEAVVDKLTIRITDEEAEPKDRKNKRKNSPKAGKGQNQSGSGQDAPTHGLPRYVLLTKDGRRLGEQETEAWPEEFGEHDGGLIHDLGENEIVYKINYDNSYHIKYRLQQKSDVARDVVTEKYILGMRILMLGYEHAYRMTTDGRNNGIGEFADEFRRMAARGASSTVLALADNLPKIVDSSSVSREVE
jgi:hypothetical protein